MALKLRREGRDEALQLFSAVFRPANACTPAPHYRHSVSFKTLRGLQHAEFSVYDSAMPNENPLAGIVPNFVHPRIDGEAAIEKIEGEVALDSYVKAQTSVPEVVKRQTQA